MVIRFHSRGWQRTCYARQLHDWFNVISIAYLQLIMSQNVHKITFIPGRGCAAAALRLWLLPDSDLPPIEMCGEKALNEHWQYITQGQSARISFTGADKAIGAQVCR
jgi:hypothetical protein